MFTVKTVKALYTFITKSSTQLTAVPSELCKQMTCKCNPGL